MYDGSAVSGASNARIQRHRQAIQYRQMCKGRGRSTACISVAVLSLNRRHPTPLRVSGVNSCIAIAKDD